ncbi:hypothetical protein UFOVP1636_166 [uncultured Caudovirales phage]|jgi:hypothetical protein|uniref:Uncharacterized protein n=1 Tax=uncultured Caudovirales phage TaxID=2100421 RepID=A0A6J5T2F4_9CAUD|nr:hypothetical protein UFOVP1636_166 [uncultured Caudovirales phage]
MSPQPRKNPRSKLKKINVSPRDQWKKILKDVEKNEIPITLLRSLNVNLIDGTVVNIDVKELIDEGNDPSAIEEMLDSRLTALDHIIVDVDFYVDVDDVAKAIQPITDQILKDL